MANLMALDVGTKRIGVALAGEIARIATPLVTIEQSDSTMSDLRRLVNDNSVTAVVVGLPRGLDGQDTPQTEYARQFAGKVKQHLDLPIFLQDESATSLAAEAKLNESKKPYTKGDIDKVAAACILDDYLSTNEERIAV